MAAANASGKWHTETGLYRHWEDGAPLSLSVSNVSICCVLQTHPTFANIYKWTSLGLAVNGMYPRGTHRGWRRILWTTVFVYLGSAFALCVYSLLLNIADRDISEATRQVAMVIPLAVMLGKMVLSVAKKAEFQSIIDEINSDYVEFAHASKKHKRIYTAAISASLKAQTIWLILSCCVTLIFPAVAVSKMLNYALHHSDNQKVMLHEVALPFVERFKYNTPIFEVIFAYCFIVVGICISNFTGFDASYLIAAQHGTAQLKIMTTSLAELFETSLDPDIRYARLRFIVQRHQKIYGYAEKVQHFYSAWFTIIVCLSSIQICLTLYQMTEALSQHEVKMEFVIFTIGTVIQIYLACRQSTIFSDASSDAATEIYSCGWENYLDKKTCFALKFMIARAQRPIKFNASVICAMDMDCFSSIINTSYSYFNLLRT